MDGSDDLLLSDLDFFAKGDPHALWRQMRARDPVHWTQSPHRMGGFWSITRHEDALAVLRDAETFSSERHGNILPTSAEVEDIDPALAGWGEMLVSTDPPRHTGVRRAFSEPFLRSHIARLETRGRELAREIVDAVAARGECDFVTDVAVKLPIAFICELLGVPRELWDQMLEWGNLAVAQDDPEFAGGRSPAEARLEGSMGMQRYCLEQALLRRERPGDDVLSVMGRADLPDPTIAFNGTLLIAAGFETTRNALAGGVLELIRAPEQMRRLRDRPELIPSAVEEMVRWTSPLTNALRTATRDTRLRGRAIREGERLAIWLPSCNRDEEVFRDPDRFDVARSPNDHIGFGYGRHYCLGAHLARLELRLMLAEIAERLPDLALDGEIERVRTNTLAGIKHMPVRFPVAA